MYHHHTHRPIGAHRRARLTRTEAMYMAITAKALGGDPDLASVSDLMGPLVPGDPDAVPDPEPDHEDPYGEDNVTAVSARNVKVTDPQERLDDQVEYAECGAEWTSIDGGRRYLSAYTVGVDVSRPYARHLPPMLEAPRALWSHSVIGSDKVTGGRARAKGAGRPKAHGARRLTGTERQYLTDARKRARRDNPDATEAQVEAFAEAAFVEYLARKAKRAALDVAPDLRTKVNADTLAVASSGWDQDH